MTPPQYAFCTLPNELFLIILDTLVGNHSIRDSDTDDQAVALAPTHPGTKALLSLCLVSHSIFPLASQYLYAHCIHLSNPTRFTLFNRTVQLDCRQDAQSGESVSRFPLFRQSDSLLYANSAYIFPAQDEQSRERDGESFLLFDHIVDVCHILGRTLKRLVLNISNMSFSAQPNSHFDPRLGDRSFEPIFASMVLLQDLVISINAAIRFSNPPAQLRRLCVVGLASLNIDVEVMNLAFSCTALQVLVLKRPEQLNARDIEKLFTRYEGRGLDVIFVDVNWNHGTPWATRQWSEDDALRLWEADVPTSFYGDEYNVQLCGEWIWRNALWGTLWGTEKRRMEERMPFKFGFDDE